jgi:hypothetical protein
MSLCPRHFESDLPVAACSRRSSDCDSQRWIPGIFVIVQRLPVQCAFLRPGIVNMMDRAATATMKTLNISAIIAAARTARLSCRP